MTQITPLTRSDDSKFSWSRSTVTFLTPDTCPRACFHFLTPDVHPRVAILSAVPVDLPNVKWIPVQLAATRFSKVLRVLRAPPGASCAGNMSATILKHAWWSSLASNPNAYF